MYKKRRRSKAVPLCVAAVAVLLLLVVFFALVSGFNRWVAANPPAAEVLPPQSAENPDETAEEYKAAMGLLGGHPILDSNLLDERMTLRYTIENMTEDYEAIAIGSSRIMQLAVENVGTTSFMNCATPAGDYRDLMNSFYLLERNGHLPQTLIIGLDPWLLNGDEAALHFKSDAGLFDEFLEYCQNDAPVEAPAEEPAGEEALGFLQSLNPVLTWQNRHRLQEYMQRGEQDTSLQTAQEPGPQPDPMEGYSHEDIYNRGWEVRLPDGSLVYPGATMNATSEWVEMQARLMAVTFMRMENFTGLDEGLCSLFDAFITHVRSTGVDIVFLLTPYHPVVYNYALECRRDYEGFFLTEPWYVNYALEHEIPIYGSFNPFILDVEFDDFYDGIHIKREAIPDIFPGAAQALAEWKAGDYRIPALTREIELSPEEALRLVNSRYEVRAEYVTDRHYLRLAGDTVVNGATCYMVERCPDDSPGAMVLAHYAVDPHTTFIYRLDDLVGDWVMDLRGPTGANRIVLAEEVAGTA